MSTLSGLSVHTLRFYEKEGLLKSIYRDGAGKRVYSEIDLQWINWIKRLKSTGMGLNDIKRFSDLREIGESSISDRKEMLINHASKLRLDIQRLETELEIVDFKVIAYQEKENKALT